MIPVRYAQPICLALAAIALAAGFYAAFTAGQLEAELLERLRSQSPPDSGLTILATTPELTFFNRMQLYAFLSALVTAGGFLVLEFNKRPWPYRLYVPAVGVGAFAAWAGEIYVTTSASLVLLLGPAGALGAGWMDNFKTGTIGVLIASVPLFLSARAGSRIAGTINLIVFALLWLSMGVVTAILIGYIEIEPAGGYSGGVPG